MKARRRWHAPAIDQAQEETVTFYRTNASERLNLDNVNRIVERPGALELQFSNGTAKVITSEEEIAKIEALLGAREMT